jgi:hypothetical protein
MISHHPAVRPFPPITATYYHFLPLFLDTNNLYRNDAHIKVKYIYLNVQNNTVWPKWHLQQPKMGRNSGKSAADIQRDICKVFKILKSEKAVGLHTKIPLSNLILISD